MRNYFLLALICILTAGMHAQSKQQKEDGRESAAYKNTKWYLSLYRIYYPDYSYRFQESFYLVQKANAGDAFAQHELGLRYLAGDGFELDTNKSIYWITKAAEQELPSACYNLAIFYNNGFREEWNPFKSFEYFHKAADLGMSEAEFAVGIFFTENLVMQKNIDSAFLWIKRAAGKGFAPAIEALGKMRAQYLEMKTTETAEGNKTEYVQDTSVQRVNKSKNPNTLAFDFMEVGTDSSSVPSDSAFFMRMLKSGSSDLRENLGLGDVDSVELLKPAVLISKLTASAYSGSPDANLFLGRFYEKGIYTKRNAVRSLMYYLRAYRLESPLAPLFINKLVAEKSVMNEIYRLTEKKDADAMFVFAALNSAGYNSMLNDETLVKYLQLAANKNHTASLLELGQCYYSGKPVKADTAKAFEYWHRAAEKGSIEGLLRKAVAELFGAGDCSKQMSMPDLLEANNSGSLPAQLILAYRYEKGLCVQADKKSAVHYYRKAAYRGSVPAFAALKRLYDEIRPGGKQFKVIE